MILWLLGIMVATVSAIALFEAANCFLHERSCSMPLLNELSGQLIAALMGIYAGSRGR